MKEAEILQITEDLRNARLAELEKGKLMAEAQASLTYEEGQVDAHLKHIIAQAYVDDQIDGKNAEIRKAQETRIIADNPALPGFEAAVREKRQLFVNAEHEYELAKIDRRYLEDQFSAAKAVLTAYGLAQD